MAWTGIDQNWSYGLGQKFAWTGINQNWSYGLGQKLAWTRINQDWLRPGIGLDLNVCIGPNMTWLQRISLNLRPMKFIRYGTWHDSMPYSGRRS